MKTRYESRERAQYQEYSCYFGHIMFALNKVWLKFFRFASIDYVQEHIDPGGNMVYELIGAPYFKDPLPWGFDEAGGL